LIRVVCFIKPHKLEAVKSAIANVGVSGLTVTEVRGTGNSEEKSAWFGGEQQVIALPIRSRVEVVAPQASLEEIISAILSQAQTGESGDGKIFVEQINDAVRIRTEERGSEAI
jgi:nitrogen regulatory protein P-II 1